MTPASSKSLKVDLHTHSEASPDGGLSAEAYRKKLESGQLDYIAITDHDRIDFAVGLKRGADSLGGLAERIIVGEEIRSSQGEIIGLYLQETIPPGMTAIETVDAIRQQGGLVYVPHPFETVRQGLPAGILELIADDVDIIEVHNGRAVFQNRGAEAAGWAVSLGWAAAASSDAHSAAGWGRTFSVIDEVPDRGNLVRLLYEANHRNRFPGMRAILSPKYNKLRKRARR